MFSILELVRDVAVLGIIAVAVIALSFSTTRTITLAPSIQVATTSLPSAVVPPTPVATTTVEKPLAQEQKPVPKPAPKSVPKPSSVATTTPPAPKPQPTITLNEAIDAVNSLAQGQTPAGQNVNDRVRAALVNILCSATQGSGSSISGSGIIIDPRGVILTNAHVAQFFLLKDYPHPQAITCAIRTGSPAYPRYTAELMFLPPAWVRDNARKIKQEAPTGTGERDYALVRITGGVSTSVTVPTQFPFLLIATTPPAIGDDVLQAGYAAGFLGGITVESNLYASSAWTKIRDVFTFNANTIDLVSLGGSIVAQGGSSGGPVTNQDGVLMGVIVTNTGTGDTSTRDLHAITTSYIVNDFESERGKSLQAVLSTDLTSEVDIFNRVYFPDMKQKLVTELEK